jgi:hypothetical protein
MDQLKKAASIAAFIIVAGMVIHNVNANYVEPYLYGFEDKATDYGDMEKIENTIGKYPFVSSGLAHMVVGFCFMVLGLYLCELFRKATPAGARFVFVAAMLAGLGFLLTGISDIPGTAYATLLRDLNPDHNTDILLQTTLFRGMVNTLAIMGLGWFAGQVAWCARFTDGFSRGFRIFGWLNTLPGILCIYSPIFGFAYLVLLPFWMLWIGFRIRALPAPA